MSFPGNNFKNNGKYIGGAAKEKMLEKFLKDSVSSQQDQSTTGKYLYHRKNTKVL